MDVVSEVLPQLILTDDDKAEAERLVQELRSELATQSPDRKVLTRLGAGLRRVVENAAGSALGSLVLSAAPGGLEAVQGLF